MERTSTAIALEAFSNPSGGKSGGKVGGKVGVRESGERGFPEFFVGEIPHWVNWVQLGSNFPSLGLITRVLT